MNLEKYTERAKGFLQAAQTLASTRGHQRLTPEHLLKVLLDDKEDTGAIVLTWWMGGYALFFGVALLILSFQLRRRRHEMSAGPVALHGI